jgi:hypothetical protein
VFPVGFVLFIFFIYVIKKKYNKQYKRDEETA